MKKAELMLMAALAAFPLGCHKDVDYEYSEMHVEVTKEFPDGSGAGKLIISKGHTPLETIAEDTGLETLVIDPDGTDKSGYRVKIGQNLEWSPFLGNPQLPCIAYYSNEIGYAKPGVYRRTSADKNRVTFIYRDCSKLTEEHESITPRQGEGGGYIARDGKLIYLYSNDLAKLNLFGGAKSMRELGNGLVWIKLSFNNLEQIFDMKTSKGTLEYDKLELHRGMIRGTSYERDSDGRFTGKMFTDILSPPDFPVRR